MKNIIEKLAVSLLIGGLVLVAVGPAGAWEVPLDFITGGGWFIQQPGSYSVGQRSNFGWHGGIKNGDWWGNGNYIDHGIGLHVHSEFVHGYFCYPETNSSCPPTDKHPTGTRDVCGYATTNLAGPFYYRVRMKDNGEPGRRDRFAIWLYSTTAPYPIVYSAWGSLGDPSPGGGNIQLHRGNNSNGPVPTSLNYCDALSIPSSPWASFD